jgi:hypothetical protein
LVVGFIPITALAVDGVNTPPAVVLGQEVQTGVATPASGDGRLPWSPARSTPVTGSRMPTTTR